MRQFLVKYTAIFFVAFLILNNANAASHSGLKPSQVGIIINTDDLT